MPFCENCGNKVSETTKFCPRCGSNIKVTFSPNQEISSDINQQKESANENVEYPYNNKLEDLTTEIQEKEVANVEKAKNKKRWYSSWWFWTFVFCVFSLITYDEKDISASVGYGMIVAFILIYNAFFKRNSWIWSLIDNSINNLWESRTGKIVVCIIIILSGLLFLTM